MSGHDEEQQRAGSTLACSSCSSQQSKQRNIGAAAGISPATGAYSAYRASAGTGPGIGRYPLLGPVNVLLPGNTGQPGTGTGVQATSGGHVRVVLMAKSLAESLAPNELKQR